MEINPNLSGNAKKDIELVEAARAGNEKAYADLMRRYKDAIYFMLLKMVNNRTDAEDLAIEALGKLLPTSISIPLNMLLVPGFSGLHQIMPLIFCAKKSCHCTSETTSGEKGVGGEYNYNVKSETDNPEEDFIRQQNAMILRKMVAKLKPRYRTLLELRYFREYTYDEIAQELNLPLGTVKVQLFRSREMLFELLKNSEMSK